MRVWLGYSLWGLTSQTTMEWKILFFYLEAYLQNWWCRRCSCLPLDGSWGLFIFCQFFGIFGRVHWHRMCSICAQTSGAYSVDIIVTIYLRFCRRQAFLDFGETVLGIVVWLVGMEWLHCKLQWSMISCVWQWALCLLICSPLEVAGPRYVGLWTLCAVLLDHSNSWLIVPLLLMGRR